MGEHLIGGSVVTPTNPLPIGLYPYPAVPPVVTVYTPSTTAYLKVTPDPKTLAMVVRARTTSDDLIYAGIVTHKIADVTTIAAANGSDDTTDRALATELKGDFNTHTASTAYHVAAGVAIADANATDDATLIALTLALNAKWLEHAASTTIHGGRVDQTMLDAVTALNLAVAPSKAQCRTYLNALKPLHAAHLVVVDGGLYATVAAGMPYPHDSLGSFFCRTSTSGGTFTTTGYRSA